ncbi:MAG: universal stress protein [Gammaproteobacteria bacterium]|nr:universal stress protein [Gammaproteobacteria bacterium]MBT7371083.1 universal stress protein [Gammaproteobacteria bacterium]
MFSKFQHILIPLDFTERNDTVLQAARDIVKETQARVSLIHVIEPIDDGDDAETQTFTQRLSNEAEEHLRERASTFDDLDTTVICENRVGKRNVEVVSYAIDQHVDLILLNSHLITPETPERNTVSLSYQIALLAPCAVLLLKS